MAKQIFPPSFPKVGQIVRITINGKSKKKCLVIESMVIARSSRSNSYYIMHYQGTVGLDIKSWTWTYSSSDPMQNNPDIKVEIIG